MTKIMTGVECLNKIKYLHKKVLSYEYDIQRYKALAEKSNSSDVIPPPTTATQPREALFIKYLDIIDEIDKRKNEISKELINLKKEAEGIINKISNIDERVIMLLRYIECKPLEKISEEIFLSIGSCWRKSNNGKKEFCRLWDLKNEKP